MEKLSTWLAETDKKFQVRNFSLPGKKMDKFLLAHSILQAHYFFFIAMRKHLFSHAYLTDFKDYSPT